MKIDPKHDYRKPISAISMAALMATGIMTGCVHDKEGSGKIEVRKGHAKETEPELMGEAETVPEIAGDEIVITEETYVEIDGGAVVETEESFELAGAVQVVETETESEG